MLSGNMLSVKSFVNELIEANVRTIEPLVGASGSFETERQSILEHMSMCSEEQLTYSEQVTSWDPVFSACPKVLLVEFKSK